MEDKDTTGVESSSSPEQQNVPITRLNEAIHRARQAEGQVQMLSDLLRKASPSPRGETQMEETPELKRLKEENPEAYIAKKRDILEKKRMNAQLFQTRDEIDRLQFLMEYKEGDSEIMSQVENKLTELRQSGVHTYNRGQIYLHLRGAKAEHMDRAAKAKKPGVSQEQKAQEILNGGKAQAKTQEDIDVPGSDPRSATVTGASSATPAAGGFDVADFETKYGDVGF